MQNREIVITITRNYGLAAIGIALLALAILFGMDRPPICACGSIKFWHGFVNSSENSQHIADWYTFSHIIHGFLFFGLGYWLFKKQSETRRLGLALCLAVFIEGAWEILENSPLIINRYREATIGLGYSGDSILNSMADLGWMTLGFIAAAKMPWKWTILVGIVFELIALYAIRDNLTLNVLMLSFPIEAVKEWQSAANSTWVVGK